MEDESIVTEDTQNFDGEENTGNEIEGQDFIAHEEQPDPFAEKNKQLFERAKKAEDELKALKAQGDPQKQEQSLPTNDSSNDRIQRLELKVDGYTDREVDFILKNGGRDALKDELVQAAITSMRDKRKSEEASQSIGTKSPIYKRHTLDELKAMPTAELEKIIPK